MRFWWIASRSGSAISSSSIARARRGSSQHIEDIARAELAAIAAAAHRCHVILVSNELGSGTVPESPVTRAFRDTQGLLNQWAAADADEVILTVAGLPLYLKTAQQAKDISK